MTHRTRVSAYQQARRSTDIEIEEAPTTQGQGNQIFYLGEERQISFKDAFDVIPLIKNASTAARESFFRFLEELKDSVDVAFLDVENYGTILEIVNMFHDGKNAREVAAVLRQMATSGDDFFWALPGMDQLEIQAQQKVEKEFLTLEGTELPFNCKDCGNNKFHQNRDPTRGDESMIVYSKCVNCGWVTKTR